MLSSSLPQLISIYNLFWEKPVNVQEFQEGLNVSLKEEREMSLRHSCFNKYMNGHGADSAEASTSTASKLTRSKKSWHKVSLQLLLNVHDIYQVH